VLSALPATAQVRQFRDWLAACDNARACVAYGLREDTTDRYLRIVRGAEPDAEAGEANALSGNLVAYWFECRAMSGAYNSWSGLVIAPRDKPQAARVVQLPYPPSARTLEGVEKHLVVNAGFDEKTLALTTFVKSRGPGDCGSAGEWVFDGKDFRLTRYQSMPLCAGLVSDEWPVIFRAEVE
jgi:hypothetical protein